MTNNVKTGQIVKDSGQYKAKGSKTEFTFVQGKKVPPGPNGVTEFVLVDKTKHKNN